MLLLRHRTQFDFHQHQMKCMDANWDNKDLPAPYHTLGTVCFIIKHVSLFLIIFYLLSLFYALICDVKMKNNEFDPALMITSKLTRFHTTPLKLLVIGPHFLCFRIFKVVLIDTKICCVDLNKKGEICAHEHEL